MAGTRHTHSSVASACEIMDVDFLPGPADERGRLTGAALRAAAAGQAGGGPVDGLFALA